MVTLKTMGYEMRKIVEKGPQIPMYQPMVDNAPIGPLKKNPEMSYDDDDKKPLSLDVKARVTIGDSLTYHGYHLVQNCESTQEIMDTLIVVYEGIVEV